MLYTSKFYEKVINLKESIVNLKDLIKKINENNFH